MEQGETTKPISPEIKSDFPVAVSPEPFPATSAPPSTPVISFTNKEVSVLDTATGNGSPGTLPADAKPQLVAGKFSVVAVNLPAGETASAKPVVVVETVVTKTETVTETKTETKTETHKVEFAVPAKKEEEESDDEEEKDDKHQVTETSPCGRYHKRRERLLQREVPGIDAAFLAMDSEEGKEVVWNEVQFSEKKNFKEKEEQIHLIFDNLINLHHPSILNFHRWWTDAGDKPRVIFITEHISSGSLNHFIKTSKHGGGTNGSVAYMPEKSWKRWSRQILTALNYLHTAKPPIVHGNLNLDTVFLQHNGLMKIGCVAPDHIHQHVRTCREHINIRNMHFVPPEYAFETTLTPAADIFSFGVLVLEMLIYGIHNRLTKDKELATGAAAAASAAATNGQTPASTTTHDGPHAVTTTNTSSIFPITLEMVNQVLDGVENGPVKQMIRDCLHPVPDMRPSAKNLLFNPAFFEVPPLKQIAAFAFVDYFSADHLDNWNDMVVSYGKDISGDLVIAENPRTKQVFKLSQLQNTDLDKYLEDIRAGVYPLTAFGVDSPTTSLLTTPAQSTRDEGESYGLGDEFEEDLATEIETRLIMSCLCIIRSKNDSVVASLELILRMEDKMNRHLVCEFDEENDAADALSEELFDYGLINDQDQEKVRHLIETTITTAYNRKCESILAGQGNATSAPNQASKSAMSVNGEESSNSPENDVASLRSQSAHVLTESWDNVVRSAVVTFNSAPSHPVGEPRELSAVAAVVTNGPVLTNGF